MCGAEEDLPRLPPRDPAGHKGTFGTVCVVGGSGDAARPMVGAPAFAALAALRTGCGLAVLAAPEPVLVAALTVAPQATGVGLPVDAHGVVDASGSSARLAAHLRAGTAFVVGPGLGEGFAQQQLVAGLIAQDAVPLVIDADGLNALAAMPSPQLDWRASAILTPHPGEYRRLAASLAIEEDPTDEATRPAAAAALAQRLGVVVLLKGARTVVSDGVRTWVRRLGNSALATAGSGDVLSGIVGSLLAQFHAQRGTGRLDLYDCARLGATIHGMAADRWAATQGGAGLLATDLCAQIPPVIESLRRG